MLPTLTVAPMHSKQLTSAPARVLLDPRVCGYPRGLARRACLRAASLAGRWGWHRPLPGSVDFHERARVSHIRARWGSIA